MKRFGWKECTLGDICKDIFAGGDVPKVVFSKEKTEKCCVPVFSNGVENDGLYGFTDIPRVVEPCVTISGRGTIGHTVLRSTPFFPIIRLIAAIPKDDVDIRYFFYAVSNIRFKSTGVTIPQLTVPAVKSCRFCYPVDKSEQQRIVDELDLLSRIVELKNTQLRTLDELAQSIFCEMFGDLITNERNWNIGTLACLIEDKRNIKRAAKHFLPNDVIHYIDISSIDNVAHKMASITKITFNEAPSRAQQIVKNGDILVSMVRPNLRNIAPVYSQGGNLVASSGFSVLRPLYSNSEFIMQLTLSDSFTKYLLTRTSGANYPAVRENDIKDCVLGIPPLEMQQFFSMKIKAIEAQKSIIYASLNTAQDLLASRMDKYFNE